MYLLLCIYLKILIPVLADGCRFGSRIEKAAENQEFREAVNIILKFCKSFINSYSKPYSNCKWSLKPSIVIMVSERKEATVMTISNQILQFDEIFHFASSAIELDHLIGFHFQRCDNKGIQMNHLPIRLFDFENHSA